MLVEGENSAEEVDVVIGAVKSNQANNKAADELEPTLTVEVKEPEAALLGFWRNPSVLAGTGVNKPTFNITIAHSTDRPTQSPIVHLFSLAAPHHIWCLGAPISGLSPKAPKKHPDPAGPQPSGP